MERRKIAVLIAALSVLTMLLMYAFFMERPSEIVAFRFSRFGVTITGDYFLTETMNIQIASPKNAVVYYTTDGSTPSETSVIYKEPIELVAATGDFPNCLLLKAIAFYGDGTCSDVATHTFFAHKDMDTWTQNLILSISGEPKELTEESDGILTDSNATYRGRWVEREVHIEAISPKGRPVFEQDAGARVYGGASRGLKLKSLKLYARREYDKAHGMFLIDAFGTRGADNAVIDKYDKLVLRNHGNDYTWGGFILDDLNQRLATQAGYTDAKATIPAVYYLNGKYNGLYWLQENVCDEYLKDKYGGETGIFAILEGTERLKTVDESDPFKEAAANEYNSRYNELAYCDLTEDGNYAKLRAFIDVENYLQYYAYNVYINNWDWPGNNYKCYRYYADSDSGYEKGRLDGKWRFLFHDMDVSFGAYELSNASTEVTYNNLQELLDPEGMKYAPLFANLMRREDCKEYFVQEIVRLMEGVLSVENIANTIYSVSAEYGSDMERFVEYMDIIEPELFEEDWATIHMTRLKEYVGFAEVRPKYMKEFLTQELELPEDYFEKIQ